MDQDIIEYRPNGLYGVIAFFLLVVAIEGILSISIFIIFKSADILELFILGIMAFVSLLIGKFLYDSSKSMVIFEKDGIRLVNDRNVRHCYVFYKDFFYGYYFYYRGNLFLILSPECMDQKKMKKIARKSVGFFGKMHMENNIVIPINGYDKKVFSKIKDLILKKIPLVEQF